MDVLPAQMDTRATAKTLSPLQNQRVLLPDHQSARTEALSFCKRVDHVEVRGSTKLHGYTHFVVHVFYKKPRSNIPTLRHKQQQAQASRSATPDATVYYRFSSFVNLRHEAYFHASNGHATTRSCSFCSSMTQLLYDGPTVPRLHMKLFHGSASIGMDLERFLNSLLELTRPLAVSPSTRVCEGQQEIPLLLQKFLTKPTDDRQLTEPTQLSPQEVDKANVWSI